MFLSLQKYTLKLDLAVNLTSVLSTLRNSFLIAEVSFLFQSCSPEPLVGCDHLRPQTSNCPLGLQETETFPTFQIIYDFSPVIPKSSHYRPVLAKPLLKFSPSTHRPLLWAQDLSNICDTTRAFIDISELWKHVIFHADPEMTPRESRKEDRYKNIICFII